LIPPATSPDGAVITAAELTPGAAAGTALHALLEHTTFTSVLDADNPEAWLDLPGNRTRVEETLRRESVDLACAPAAARAVWNALRCPLPEPDATNAPAFRLADLKPDDIRHEVEFVLSFQASAGDKPADSTLPDGVSVRGAFLWGFIDLVFRREGRYYLLDWKSNLLPDYGAEAVRHAMDAHRYDLQWKLYSVALDRWLTARLPDYDPEKHFGGVHYLFLRGATPEYFAGYSGRPTPAQLRGTFPAEIAALLASPRRREVA
jgi:exodeoxyribonuclease V beta subunit